MNVITVHSERKLSSHRNYVYIDCRVQLNAAVFYVSLFSCFHQTYHLHDLCVNVIVVSRGTIAWRWFNKSHRFLSWVICFLTFDARWMAFVIYHLFFMLLFVKASPADRSKANNSWQLYISNKIYFKHFQNKIADILTRRITGHFWVPFPRVYTTCRFPERRPLCDQTYTGLNDFVVYTGDKFTV